MQASKDKVSAFEALVVGGGIGLVMFYLGLIPAVIYGVVVITWLHKRRKARDAVAYSYNSFWES